MNDNEKDKDKVNIRHTINAEETFTLAKDVYDIRNLIKNVYSNRALIARRLNILTLSISLVFTLLYIAYMFGTGLFRKLSLGSEIVLYCLLGVYAVLFAALFAVTLCGFKAKAKSIGKYNKVLSYFRLSVRLLSVAITIAALVFATQGGDYAAPHIALDVILIIFSVICLVFQAIPLICGGFGKLARWLLSPVKIKYRFSTVALEWYELAVTSASESKIIKRISKKYYDEIGVCLDNFIIPNFGKKYVTSIKPTQILSVVESAAEEDRTLVEGILKSVFAYAEECGYVTFDPCKDLQFEGSIDEEEKPQKQSVKSRFLGMVLKKVGKPMLDKYIDKSSGSDE